MTRPSTILGLPRTSGFLIILFLLLPVGWSIASLLFADYETLASGKVDSWASLLVFGGFIAAFCVSAVFWSRYPKLRGLPVIYGVFLAAEGAFGRHGLAWSELAGAALAGAVMGMGLVFSIWIETLGDQR